MEGYIYSDNKKTKSLKGKSLFDFADTLSIRVPTSCRRNGECHECIVNVNEGEENLIPKDISEEFLTDSYRLACQAKIDNEFSDIKFNVLRRQPKILEDLKQKDLILNSKIIVKDDAIFDKGNSTILSTKVTPIYGIAADIGTTTVACSLVDLVTGEIIGISSFENPQRFGGSDTLNRISYETTKFPGELQAVIISGLNFEIGELCKKYKVRRSHIYEMVIVGNTTMREDRKSVV